MAKNYLINEGNQIGYIGTYFGSNVNNSLTEEKIIAGANVAKGEVVMLSDALKVIKTNGASANCLGVAMFDTKENDPIAIECEGLMRLTAGGAITAPVKVVSANAGKVAAFVANTNTIDQIIGVALSDAAADGDDVIVRLSI